MATPHVTLEINQTSMPSDLSVAVTTRYSEVDDPPLRTHLLYPHDRCKALHNRRDSCILWKDRQFGRTLRGSVHKRPLTYKAQVRPAERPRRSLPTLAATHDPVLLRNLHSPDFPLSLQLLSSFAPPSGLLSRFIGKITRMEQSFDVPRPL